ncbi:hypothetical protein BJ875DRAFT_385578 [Amylocarpus encephaloides]|uniref:Uncharacterized protein n=1 Tax=Amylocarpus encephaloides TaxID=45428 RepID=A0A9P8C1U6_9HELO|nr:hypothetical protein BJ875DRAFT_385578 [Amylocarpus encephaloides]
MSSKIPSETAQAQKAADSSAPSTCDLAIETTDIKTVASVNLSAHQQVLVGSVLDLFSGRPSLKKLQLWTDDATFADPLTKAEGRKQYEAQWYGLKTAFSEIERLSYSVTSGGNPISMDLKTRYVVKGIKKEQTIESVVNIHTDAEGKKISLVEDKWNGQLPDGAFTNASQTQVLRNLNSVVVPAFVSVPKNEEEDAKKGN